MPYRQSSPSANLGHYANAVTKLRKDPSKSVALQLAKKLDSLLSSLKYQQADIRYATEICTENLQAVAGGRLVVLNRSLYEALFQKSFGFITQIEAFRVLSEQFLEQLKSEGIEYNDFKTQVAEDNRAVLLLLAGKA